MNKYRMTVKATVFKTFTVEANNEIEAYELAHAFFSTEPDDIEEKYYEEVDDCVLVS